MRGLHRRSSDKKRNGEKSGASPHKIKYSKIRRYEPAEFVIGHPVDADCDIRIRKPEVSIDDTSNVACCIHPGGASIEWGHCEMEEGVILDKTYRTTFAQVWTKRSVISVSRFLGPKRATEPLREEDGLQFPSDAVAQMKVISTFRCKNCGFLESYAK
jgi:hypothetical protein